MDERHLLEFFEFSSLDNEQFQLSIERKIVSELGFNGVQLVNNQKITRLTLGLL